MNLIQNLYATLSQLIDCSDVAVIQKEIDGNEVCYVDFREVDHPEFEPGSLQVKGMKYVESSYIGNGITRAIFHEKKEYNSIEEYFVEEVNNPWTDITNTCPLMDANDFAQNAEVGETQTFEQAKLFKFVIPAGDCGNDKETIHTIRMIDGEFDLVEF